ADEDDPARAGTATEQALRINGRGDEGSTQDARRDRGERQDAEDGGGRRGAARVAQPVRQADPAYGEVPRARRGEHGARGGRGAHHGDAAVVQDEALASRRSPRTSQVRRR